MTKPGRSKRGSKKVARHWQAHIEAQEKSGLNRTEYCRRHNISYHAMTYWLRKYRKHNTSQPTLVPASFQAGLNTSPPSSSGNVVRVVLPGDIAVEVSDSFTPSTLASVLSVLEAGRR